MHCGRGTNLSVRPGVPQGLAGVRCGGSHLGSAPSSCSALTLSVSQRASPSSAVQDPHRTAAIGSVRTCARRVARRRTAVEARNFGCVLNGEGQTCDSRQASSLPRWRRDDVRVRRVSFGPAAGWGGLRARSDADRYSEQRLGGLGPDRSRCQRQRVDCEDNPGPPKAYDLTKNPPVLLEPEPEPEPPPVEPPSPSPATPAEPGAAPPTEPVTGEPDFTG
jgi:hypothetical protein